MRQDVTLISSGVLGVSQAQNTTVTFITVPGPGRYKVWGHGRHTLVDGLKLSSPTTLILAGGAGDTVVFGPLVLELTTNLNISIALNTATGAADTASCTLYAEKINH